LGWRKVIKKMSVNTIKIDKIETEKFSVSDIDFNFAGRNVIYVSKGTAATDTRGTLSKYDANVPFATIAQALSASSSGDYILVEPGEYLEALELKDGVVVELLDGVTVTRNDTNGLGPIISTPEASGTYTLIGKGKLLRTGTILNEETNNPVVAIKNAGVTYFECFSVQNAYNSGSDAAGIRFQGTGTSYVKVHSVVAVYDAILSYNPGFSGTAYIKAHILKGTGGSGSALEIAGGTFYVDADIIESEIAITAPPVLLFVTAFLQISNATIESNSSIYRAISLEGGTLELKKCRVNGSISLGEEDTSGVASLYNTVILTAATNSIFGDESPVIKVYDAYSNKAVAGNVTQQVGTVTVDANVS
jgi:hypothetical protein